MGYSTRIDNVVFDNSLTKGTLGDRKFEMTLVVSWIAGGKSKSRHAARTCDKVEPNFLTEDATSGIVRAFESRKAQPLPYTKWLSWVDSRVQVNLNWIPMVWMLYPLLKLSLSWLIYSLASRRFRFNIKQMWRCKFVCNNVPIMSHIFQNA